MVGLRWWSDYDADGKEVWKFESYDTDFKSNPVDTAFFWTSQLLSTLVWTGFLVITIIGFKPYWVKNKLCRHYLISLIYHYQLRIFMVIINVEVNIARNWDNSKKN